MPSTTKSNAVGSMASGALAEERSKTLDSPAQESHYATSSISDTVRTKSATAWVFCSSVIMGLLQDIVVSSWSNSCALEVPNQ